MSSALTAIGLASTVLEAAVLLILLGVVIIIVVGSRAEPDPSGRRPFTVYYFAASYVSLFACLFASYAVVTSILSLAGSGSSGDAVARSVMLGLLVLGFAGVVFSVHLRRGLALARLGQNPLDPSLRVAQTYVAAVSFLAVLIGIVAAVAALYSIFGAIGPGVFNPSGNRTGSLRSLVDTLYLAVASIFMLTAHLRLAPPYLRPFGDRGFPVRIGGLGGRGGLDAARGADGAAPPAGTPAAPGTAPYPSGAPVPPYQAPPAPTPPPFGSTPATPMYAPAPPPPPAVEPQAAEGPQGPDRSPYMPPQPSGTGWDEPPPSPRE